jgi:FKBP-type peptidyl-prolyl cis-trans isomerase
MKSKQLLYLGLVPLLFTAGQQAIAETAETGDTAKPPVASLESDVEIYSYGVGYQIGNQMASAPIEMEAESLVAGIKDALAQVEPQVDPQRLQEVSQRMQTEMQALQAAEVKEQSDVNAQAAQAFLQANGAKEGVVTLDSGLQYRVITSADGAKPSLEDTVLVDYRGTLVDGTEFDSSIARGEPATFPVNAVIKGWQDALQLMNVGSKWEVFIPPELAYGSGGQGPIPPSSALIFEVELLEIKPAGE